MEALEYFPDGISLYQPMACGHEDVRDCDELCEVI